MEMAAWWQAEEKAEVAEADVAAGGCEAEEKAEVAAREEDEEEEEAACRLL